MSDRGKDGACRAIAAIALSLDGEMSAYEAFKDADREERLGALAFLVEVGKAYFEWVAEIEDVDPLVLLQRSALSFEAEADA